MRRQFARLVPVLFASAAGMFGTTAFAEQGEIEEVVVTGSYIRGTPEDAASPVDVTTREDMDLQGNPSVVDMLRNMGPMAWKVFPTSTCVGLVQAGLWY